MRRSSPPEFLMALRDIHRAGLRLEHRRQRVRPERGARGACYPMQNKGARTHHRLPQTRVACESKAAKTNHAASVFSADKPHRPRKQRFPC